MKQTRYRRRHVRAFAMIPVASITHMARAIIEFCPARPTDRLWPESAQARFPLRSKAQQAAYPVAPKGLERNSRKLLRQERELPVHSEAVPAGVAAALPVVSGLKGALMRTLRWRVLV